MCHDSYMIPVFSQFIHTKSLVVGGMEEEMPGGKGGRHVLNFSLLFLWLFTLDKTDLRACYQ